MDEKPNLAFVEAREALSAFDFCMYDYEALGLRASTDQITQYANVVIDPQSSSIEKTNIHVRRHSYSIPGPRALEVTHLSPDDIENPNRLTEYSAAKAIHKVTSERRNFRVRVFGGFNILGYDEKLQRHLLFRNLFDPYVTSGRTSRKLDLFPFFQFLNFVRPGVVKPLIKPDGSRGWRLEELMKANELVMDVAHDADHDNDAVVELLRKAWKHAPDHLLHFIELSDKSYMGRLLSENSAGEKYVMYYSHYGRDEVRPIAPLVRCGSGDRMICLDLSRSTREWLALSAEEIAEQVFRPDSPFILTDPKKCPILYERTDPKISAVLEERQYLNAVQAYEARAITAREADHMRRFARASEILESRNKERFAGEALTSEERIYDRFPSRSDKDLCRRFHETEDWHERVALVGRLADDRLRDFGNRLIALYAPEELQTEASCSALIAQYRLRLRADEAASELVTTVAAARTELSEVRDQETKVSLEGMLNRLEDEATKGIVRLEALREDIRMRALTDFGSEREIILACHHAHAVEADLASAAAPPISPS